MKLSPRLGKFVRSYVESLGGSEKWYELRHKCQTDLWFLAKDIFGLPITEYTHRNVIDFFLKKTPFEPAFESDFDPSNPSYNLTQVHEAIKVISEQRRGVLLYPRGTYKSMLDGYDIVQWIINFPDIRILILVGVADLAESGFVPQIKNYFTLEKNSEPTLFQKLFPEFIIDIEERDSDRGGKSEYWSPARKLTNQKEPTLGGLAVGGATSGWHYDIFKADDVITDSNSDSEKKRTKVQSKFINTMNLAEGHSIIELIGTRYHPEDLYAHVLKKFTNPRYVVAASWTPLPHAVNKPIHDLIKEDVLLLWPEGQNFEYLKERLELDEREFRNQQLNDPSYAVRKVIFKVEDLRAATCAIDSPTSTDRRFNFWDTALSNRTSSDFTVGVFASIDSAYRVYIHYIVVDRFSPTELAFQIAKLAKDTQPEVVMAERWVGVEAWLEKEVTKQAVSMGYQIPLRLFKTDKSADAKANRISGLEPLLKNKRLFFSNKIPNIEQVYKQFVEFTGERNSKKHDDIPDAISFVRLVLPMAGLELPASVSPTRPLGNAPENAAWNNWHGTTKPSYLLPTSQGQSSTAPLIPLRERNPYFE